MKNKNAITTYLNNPNLKAARVPIEYTPEQIKEYIKCKSDPIYFIENYCKIVSLDRGLVLFKMYPYQKRMIDAMVNNRYVISMLPR